MSEFKGTKGPWEKHVRKGKIMAVIPKYYGERRLENILQTGTIHDDDCGVPSCCCVEEHANAQLISAAPELLDALQLLLRAWQSDGSNAEDFFNMDIDSIAQSAINKALGL